VDAITYRRPSRRRRYGCVPVEPVERFLGYLASVEWSPNTIKAYAHDLKDWFSFLALRGLDWRTATLEDVASFVAWLRLPPAAREGTVTVLPAVAHHCSGASVNRKLAALTSFTGFHARLGVPLATSLVMMTATGRRGSSATSYRPFLQHINKQAPQRRRMIAMPAPMPRPQVLSAWEAQAVLDACEHLRDRLLFALLLDTGMRIGETLALRQVDVDLAEDDTVGVVESGQQMPSRLITPGGAAQRLAVDRDDPSHIGNGLAAGQRPAAEALVERLGIQGLQHPAKRRLARHRLPDPELRQRRTVGVGGPFRDRDERAGPGQYRAQRQPQHRGELMADTATFAGVTDRVQDRQRVRQIIAERRADSLQLVDDRADR